MNESPKAEAERLYEEWRHSRDSLSAPGVNDAFLAGYLKVLYAVREWAENGADVSVNNDDCYISLDDLVKFLEEQGK